MIKNLVLSGGEYKGLAYVGVLKYLEDTNILAGIENIMGVSIGAVFALYFSLGFTSDQLKQIVLAMKIENLREGDYSNYLEIFNTYGLDSGSNIVKFFKISIKKKLGNENATFSDFHVKYPKLNLILTGTDLNNEITQYYSYKDSPNMEIWEAVRISASFPIYFNSVIKNDKHLIDGGVINNYPIDYFKDDLEHTIGILVKNYKKNNEIIIDSFEKYLFKIINCMINSFQNYIEKQYSNNTIILEVNYNIFDFNFSNEVKEELIGDGYTQFKEKYEKLNKKLEIPNEIPSVIDTTISEIIINEN